MTKLPPGWIATTLGALAYSSRPRCAPQDLPNLPYVGMEHIESHTGKLLGTVLARSMKSTAFHFSPGDVLYGRLRPYLNKVHLSKSEGLCSSEFIVLSTKEAILPEFLSYRLRQQSFVEFANSQNQGDRPRVSYSQIAPFRIALPPKGEQRRIVAKLEALLDQVRSAQTRLDRIPTILKRFRQSVLVAACSGKLTLDWKPRASLRPKPLEIVAVEAKDSLELDLPGSWRQVRLGALLDSLKYGTSRRCDYGKRGVPILRIPNIQAGVVDCTDLKYTILPKAEMRELSLTPGDLLMVRSNGSVALVGRIAVVSDAQKGFGYAGYLMRLRANRTLIDYRYLSLALRLPSTRAQIEIPARSTSGVHNINSQEVRSLIIPLPPKEEQAEIVRRVESLFELADQIEARYNAAQASVDQLTQSILAKAFRGELVPQDPKDEPADILLMRIQAQSTSRSPAVA